MLDTMTDAVYVFDGQMKLLHRNMACDRMQVGIGAHQFRVSTEEGMPACIDPDRVEQVISNLISNATKYSREGTDISVSLERRDGRALLSERDRGYGIPRDQQPFIFPRFYRASTGERKSGAGLGLYVSKRIVEAHSGRIWFDSKEARGGHFYVELLPQDGCRQAGPATPATIGRADSPTAEG